MPGNRRRFKLKPRSARTGPIGERNRTPKPTAGRNSLKLNLIDAAKHVADVDEAHAAQPLPIGRPELGVQEHQTVATGREPLIAERVGGWIADWRVRARAQPIEHEPAHGRIAAGEEPLACRNVVDEHLDGLSVRIEDRLSVGIHLRRQPLEPFGEADAHAGDERDALARQLPIPEGLRVTT